MQPTNSCYTALISKSRPAHTSAASQRDDRSIDAVLVGSRALIAVAARSLGAVEDTVTLVQYRALVLLASRGEMNVGALADAFELHQSTVTRLCDRLVTKGLVARIPSAESRREVFVALTPAGQALVNSVTARRRNEIGKIMARLSRGQRSVLVEAFTAFGDAAGETPDEAWKLGWTA
jgi:DNA-binding MarR family transcriptional regulator